jgi:hypothetical protein
MNIDNALPEGFPSDVLETIAALLEPTHRGVLRHVTPECSAAVRAVCAAEDAPDGQLPGTVSCVLSASCLVRSLDLVLWARAQGCPWTLKQWMEKSAGEGLISPKVLNMTSLVFMLQIIHICKLFIIYYAEECCLLAGKVCT